MGLEGLPPGGLSMSPGDRRGRVRLSLSPAEERRRMKALEQKEQMLTSDPRMATALLLHKEAECLGARSRAAVPTGGHLANGGVYRANGTPLTLGEVDALNSGC